MKKKDFTEGSFGTIPNFFFSLFFLLSISDPLHCFKYRRHNAHIYILTPHPKNMLDTNPVKIDNGR